MSREKIGILSGKFSIGLLSHIYAFYEMGNKCNFECYMILANGYRKFIDVDNERKNIIYINPIYKIHLPKLDCLIIYNISYIDNIIIDKIRKNKLAKVIFVYHEPWTTWKKELVREHTPINIIKAIGRHYLANRILKKADEIWLPSKHAREIFTQYYGEKYQYAEIPLIFLREKSNGNEDRKYFSYIATVSYQKRFKEFLDFIAYASKRNKQLKFLIATRSNIEKYLTREIKHMIDAGCLEVHHGRELSIAEINYYYSVTWCNWLLYRSSTQSGVFANACMLGTPCVVPDLPAFTEYVKNKDQIIRMDASNEEIYSKIMMIKNNLTCEIEQAKKIYCKNFSIDANADLFKERIINVING